MNRAKIPTYDYHEAAAAIRRGLDRLERVRTFGGQMNVPPTMTPEDVRAEMDKLNALLDLAAAEFGSARQALPQIPRPSLRLVAS